MTQIQTVQASQLATAKASNPIAAMLEAVMAKGITADSVGVLKEMMDLFERTEAKIAEKEFAAAFSLLQAEVPEVVAMKAIPDNNKNVKFTYAPYEDIMREVKPYLARHGFSLTFDTAFFDGRVTVTCTLTHSGGHFRDNRFTARVGKGPPNSSEAQGDGAATTYAKRFALCLALNISTGPDSDARNIGDSIDPQLADEIERRVAALTDDPSSYLALAGADSFHAIGTAKVDALLRAIESKERAVKAKPSRTFASPGEWRAAMLEALASRGAEKPEQAFAAILTERGYSSYLAFPDTKMGPAFDAVNAGKLDKYFK